MYTSRRYAQGTKIRHVCENINQVLMVYVVGTGDGGGGYKGRGVSPLLFLFFPEKIDRIQALKVEAYTIFFEMASDVMRRIDVMGRFDLCAYESMF